MAIDDEIDRRSSMSHSLVCSSWQTYQPTCYSALHIVMAEDAQKVQQAVDILLPLIASGRNPPGEGATSSRSEPRPEGLHNAPPQRGKPNMAVAYMSM